MLAAVVRDGGDDCDNDGDDEHDDDDDTSTESPEVYPKGTQGIILEPHGPPKKKSRSLWYFCFGLFRVIVLYRNLPFIDCALEM